MSIYLCSTPTDDEEEQRPFTCTGKTLKGEKPLPKLNHPQPNLALNDVMAIVNQDHELSYERSRDVVLWYVRIDVNKKG
jgi:hypothetical protein